MTKSFTISTRSWLNLLLVILAAMLTYQLRDLLTTLLISITLVAALSPAVTRLVVLKIPRPISIIFIYLVLLSFLTLLVTAVATPLFDQSRKLLILLPTSLSQVDFLSLHQEELTAQFLNQIGSLPQNVLRLVLGIFSNIFSLLTILVLTFYLLLEKEELLKSVHLLPSIQASLVAKIASDVEFRLGGWVRGQLILMFTIGIITFVGLQLLGIDGAVPLAIIAGVLEILPNIGPVMAAIPAVLIALTVHPLLAVGVILFYIIVQFFENHLLVPRIMGEAIGINPLAIILTLMAGNQIAGPIGAILAVPVFVVIRSIVTHLQTK
jgi:predicted PurR-regulated permease PerM